MWKKFYLGKQLKCIWVTKDLTNNKYSPNSVARLASTAYCALTVPRKSSDPLKCCFKNLSNINQQIKSYLGNHSGSTYIGEKGNEL